MQIFIAATTVTSYGSKMTMLLKVTTDKLFSEERISIVYKMSGFN